MDPRGGCPEGNVHNSDDDDRSEFIEIELSAGHRELVPCGGTLWMHALLPSSTSGGGESVDHKECLKTSSENFAREILGSGGHVFECDVLPDAKSLRPNNNTNEMNHNRPLWWPRCIQHTSDPDAPQSKHFRLESIPLGHHAGEQHQDSSSPGIACSILHAQKLPQFLVICTQHLPSLPPPAATTASVRDALYGISCSSCSWMGLEETRAYIHQGVCAARGGSVVGIDLVGHGDGVLSCAWVMYVSGLADIDRGDVASWVRDLNLNLNLDLHQNQKKEKD